MFSQCITRHTVICHHESQHRPAPCPIFSPCWNTPICGCCEQRVQAPGPGWLQNRLGWAMGGLQVGHVRLLKGRKEHERRWHLLMEKWPWGTSPAAGPQKWWRCTHEPGHHGVCSCGSCNLCSQVTGLLQAALLRKGNVLIALSLPHTALVLFIILNSFLSPDHFCFPSRKECWPYHTLFRKYTGPHYII